MYSILKAKSVNSWARSQNKQIKQVMLILKLFTHKAQPKNRRKEKRRKKHENEMKRKHNKEQEGNWKR
mgnify:CR=1 FL=1